MNIQIQPSERSIVTDIGGTNCRIGVVQEGTLLDHKIFPTPRGSDEFFHKIGNQILTYGRQLGSPYTCGIALPGVVSHHEGTARGVNIPGLDEPFSVFERLVAEYDELQDYRFALLNDAEAATLAAAKKFADGQNENPLLYIGIGTGVGSDTCQNYETLSYTIGAPFEMASLPLRRDNTYSTLGSRISGTAIRALYGEGTRAAQQLYADPDTQAIWDSIGIDLAQGIGVVAPLLNPSQVIIGGGVGANCSARIQHSLKSELDAIFSIIPESDARKPQISFVPPHLEKTLGLHGCGLALNRPVKPAGYTR